MTFIYMDAQSWPCVCLACSFWCIVYCTSVHSYICIIAPHLGTIDEPREGRDIVTEHEDDVWWTYSEEAKNQEYMLGPECSPSEYHLTNTDSVLIPGKLRCTSYYFKFITPIYVSITCALGLGIVWNSSCMIPRFPWIILACIGR